MPNVSDTVEELGSNKIVKNWQNCDSKQKLWSKNKWRASVRCLWEFEFFEALFFFFLQEHFDWHRNRTEVFMCSPLDRYTWGQPKNVKNKKWGKQTDKAGGRHPERLIHIYTHTQTPAWMHRQTWVHATEVSLHLFPFTLSIELALTPCWIVLWRHRVMLTGRHYR